jgi:hypothetical protein
MIATRFSEMSTESAAGKRKHSDDSWLGKGLARVLNSSLTQSADAVEVPQNPGDGTNQCSATNTSA